MTIEKTKKALSLITVRSSEPPNDNKKFSTVHGLTYQSLLPQPSVHVGQFGMIEMGWLTERGRLLEYC